MKNYIFILITFFTFQTQAQDVPEQQQVLISKVAATWCPPCGGWGWDLFDNLIIDNEQKAVLLVAHHSGDLTNSTAEDFSDNFEAPYQPYFYVNTTDQGASSGNVENNRIAIKEAVDNAYTVAPIANAGMNLSASTDVTQMQIAVKTKFFQDASGEFYLGVYPVESGIVNNQQGQGPEAIHEKILRPAITPGSFGELLVNGDVTAGTEFTHSYTTTLNGSWDLDHLEVVAIIWEKVNDKYEVVNVNSADEIFVLTKVEDLAIAGADMEVQPTIIRDQGQINITLEQPIEGAQIQLFDLMGRQVSTLHKGNLAIGAHNISIDNTTNYSGVYFVVLSSNEDKVLTRKVIFE